MIECSCCDPVVGSGGGGGGSTATATNIGTGAEVYVTGSSSPFEFRTLVSNGSVSIVQTADEIALTVPAMTPLSNVGGGQQVYTGTPNQLRSITGSGSAVVTSNATEINVAVTPPVALSNVGGGAGIYTGTPNQLKSLVAGTNITLTPNATEILIDATGGGGFPATYFEAVNFSFTTNGTAYVNVWTTAATPMLIGETWLLHCRWLHANLAGLSTVNCRNRWLIETAPAVFSVLEDNLNQNEQMGLAALNVASPRERFYRIIPTFDNPRFLLQMSMSAAVATGGVTQNPGIFATRKA